jgi:sec-independent protein translocase protein TatC
VSPSGAGRGPTPLDDDERNLDEVEQFRMPLLDHLRELRNRLVISVVAIGIGLCVSLAFVDEILAFATAPLRVALAAQGKADTGLAIVNSPFEGITVWLNTALIGGIILASPVIAYQVWAFIAPGLYQTERRMVTPLAFSSTGLFLLGAAFAYYVVFPFAFPFFITVIDVDVSLSIEGYLGSVLKMYVAFGASFQLPIATFFAARLGLIDHRDMIGMFRYGLVAIFVVAAIITPPDVLSQVLVAMPLTVLYIISIGVAWMFTTKVRS